MKTAHFSLSVFCVGLVIASSLGACGRGVTRTTEPNGETGTETAGGDTPDPSADLPPAPPPPRKKKDDTTGGGPTSSAEAYTGTISALRRAVKPADNARKVVFPEAVVVGIHGNGKAAYIADPAGGPYSGIELKICDDKNVCANIKPSKLGATFKVEGTLLVTTDGTHLSVASPKLTDLGVVATVKEHKTTAVKLSAASIDKGLLGTRLVVDNSADDIVVSDVEPDALVNNNNTTANECRTTGKNCCAKGPRYNGVEVSVGDEKFYVTTGYYNSAANNQEGFPLSGWPCNGDFSKALKVGDKLSTLKGVFDISYGVAQFIPTQKTDAVVDGGTTGTSGATGTTGTSGTTGPTGASGDTSPFTGTIAQLRQSGRASGTQVTIEDAVVTGVSGNGKAAYLADAAGGAFSGIEVVYCNGATCSVIKPNTLGARYRVQATLGVTANGSHWSLLSPSFTALSSSASVPLLATNASKLSGTANVEVRGARVSVNKNGADIVVTDVKPVALRNSNNTTEVECETSGTKCCTGGPRYTGFEVSVGANKFLVTTGYYNSANNSNAGFPLTGWPCSGDFSTALKVGDRLTHLNGVFDISYDIAQLIPTQSSDSAKQTGTTPPPQPEPEPEPTGGYCASCESDGDCAVGNVCLPYDDGSGSYCGTPCAGPDQCGEDSVCWTWVDEDTGWTGYFCGPHDFEVCPAN